MQVKSFAEILKGKREEFGYKQCEVAEMLYLSSSTYSHYEAGTRLPTIENLIKISALYNMNPLELLYIFAPEDIKSNSETYFNFIRHGKYALSTKELHLLSDFNMLSNDQQNAIINMTNLFKKVTYHINQTFSSTLFPTSRSPNASSAFLSYGFDFEYLI